MKKLIRTCLAAGILLISFQSCVSVAQYERMYLNDIDMQIVDSDLESFEMSFQSYREGAAGANGGSVGGGCGCN